MNFKSYRYVNVAVNGVQNRNGIYYIGRLGSPQGKTDTYCTYFRYKQDMKDHFHEKQSVSGFQGKAWSDWLPIDIDVEGNLEKAQFYLQSLVENLSIYEVDPNTCRFYFSGSKGFHVMIPAKYFASEPSTDIHKRFRNVALQLAKGIDIDTAIYDKTRLFRLANTIHSKSGLYKVELSNFEAIHLDTEEIKEMAKNPREKLDIETDFDPSEELTEIFNADLYKPKNNKSQKTKYKVCLQTLMKGVGEGERDNVGVRVASHLRQSGLTPKMMWSALDEWNETNDPPLNDDEMERIFAQGMQDYEFGCHDPILKQHCDPDCIFYKEEWNRF